MSGQLCCLSQLAEPIPIHNAALRTVTPQHPIPWGISGACTQCLVGVANFARLDLPTIPNRLSSVRLRVAQ
jgi:hypothetical protein